MNTPEMEKGRDKSQYWKRVWEKTSVDSSLIDREARSKRFHIISRFIQDELGACTSLHVAEIGAGLGHNALLLAQQGAKATLIDSEWTVLLKARSFFNDFGVRASLVCGDIFQLQGVLTNRFDVVMSFGLAEHFRGAQRKESLKAHIRMTRPGGLIVVSVPHQYSPLYRLQKTALSLLRKWQSGYRYFSRSGTTEAAEEYPFSRKELLRLTEHQSCSFRSVKGVGFLEPVDDFLKFIRYPLEKFGASLIARHFTLSDIPLPLFDNALGKHLVFLAKKSDHRV